MKKTAVFFFWLKSAKEQAEKNSSAHVTQSIISVFPNLGSKTRYNDQKMSKRARDAERKAGRQRETRPTLPGKKKRSASEKLEEKKNIIHLVLIQTLTPISPPPSISQPERICVRCASYSAQPFTVTIPARGNQLKLKIKSHLILPDQTPPPHPHFKES